MNLVRQYKLFKLGIDINTTDKETIVYIASTFNELITVILDYPPNYLSSDTYYFDQNGKCVFKILDKILFMRDDMTLNKKNSFEIKELIIYILQHNFNFNFQISDLFTILGENFTLCENFYNCYKNTKIVRTTK